MKSLDGSLLMDKDGERTTISTRVGELSAIIPQYLGVSEAILDSVIFCHQDESLWPMSEPGVLKKKFDEIFEAQKYTRAIENLKTLRKNQGNELQNLKVREDVEKTNKAKAEKVERRSQDLEAEIEELRVQEQELSARMENARAISKEKQQRAQEAHGIVTLLTAKKDEVKYKQQHIQYLRDNNLEELEESDEWLNATLQRYKERVQQMEDDLEIGREHYTDLNNQLEASRKKMSEKNREQGQHQAAKANHEANLEQRVLLIKEAAHRHSMRGYDGDLNEDQVSEFVERVRRSSREKDKELERVQRTREDEERQTQAGVREVELRRSTRTQDRLTARNTIAANDRTAKSLQNDMGAITIDEGARAILKSSHSDVKDRLRKATSDFEAAEWEKKLHSENARLLELENDAQRLRDDLVQSTRLATDRAQLELKKKDLKDRQRSLDTMLATYSTQLSSIIGSDWQIDALDRDFQAALDEKTQVLADAKKQQEGTSRELSNIEYKSATARESLRKMKEELKACESTVLSATTTDDGNPISSVEDYEEEVERLQSDRDALQKDMDGWEYVTDFYSKCLSAVEIQDKCKLCDRKFNDETSRSAFTKKLRKKIAKDARDSTRTELDFLKQCLQTAQAARLHYDTFQKLSKTDIPVLETDLAKIEDQKQVILERISKLDGSVTEAETAKKDADGLKKSVDTMSRYRGEISNYESDVSRISTQQKMSGGSLTADEIEEQANACDEQIRALRNKVNKMVADDHRAKSSINSLELELSGISSKLDKADTQLDKKKDLLSRIEELRTFSSQQRAAMERADSDLEALVPELEKAKAQHENSVQRGKAKEKEVTAEKQKLGETVHEFKVIDDAIRAYIDGGGPEKLAACQRNIRTIEKEQSSLGKEISKVTATNNELHKKIDDSSKYERSITDNLQYRKSLREIESLDIEITELEKRQSTDDYDRLAREASNAEKHYQKLSAERGPILGAMKSKDEELDRMLVEWDTDYKHAAQNYREAHIRVETTKAAIEDLGRYRSAVDAAVMKYHSLKMEEINRIAGELWQSTYQGTDVDTVLIRSENENATAKSKNNYNYRVCMVKQDAEMDMRGRCSAGQRVLASIIIRLALAECFGVNCGIIALDEPTTNLDADNIRSLAESLHNIIKVRRQQQNFQLIVITHDEEFLKHMKCSEFADNYWRVGRNEKQKSTIEKHPVSELRG
ncbi:DNA repair protein rad50 [Phlyctema vagabunda]|uniref:DNA repair protein rad50 n=1 Tax=Phlyctema vagabunda TaxID=108571 RepID=A0ABR4PJD3_9HELO